MSVTYVPEIVQLDFSMELLAISSMCEVGSRGGTLLVNLVNFFLQADSTSIKGIYPEYENQKF